MYTGATGAYAPFREVFPGKGMSCSEVGFTVFDCEEHKAYSQTHVGGVVDSPAALETVETDSLQRGADGIAADAVVLILR